METIFKGNTLLIDAIKRGDSFSAQFLLDKKCNVNLTARDTNDTALHYVCTYDEKTTESETFKEMLAVGKKILQMNVEVNIQNSRG